MCYEANKNWRKKNPKARQAQTARNYAKTQASASNSRRTWSSEDDSLVESFSGTDTELALKIGRSVLAIQVRRAKLQKIKS